MTTFQLLQTCPGCGGDWGMGGMWGAGGGGFLWGLLWLVVLGAIVLAAVYLFTRRQPASGADPAMAALREQYARGEISNEEFEERRERLSAG